MQSKMATSLGDQRSLGHYCPRNIYEIFMTTAIITPATISLYFVMGVSGGAEFLNAPYHCKVAIAGASKRTRILGTSFKHFLRR